MPEPLRPGLERFPRRVTREEVPEAVWSALTQAEDPAAVALLMIMPPQEYAVTRKNWLRYLPFGWRITPPRWIAFGACQLTVIEAGPGDIYHTTIIPYAAILDLKLVSVLLYAYVEFAWLESAGVERLRIEFNFVGERLVQRGLDHLRAALRVGVRQGEPVALPPAMGALPLKFRNYLRGSLLPSESLLDVAYQPAVRRSDSRLHRYLSPNRAIALTDHAVIVIEEDHPQSRRDYMMIQRYYPLAHVQSALFSGSDPIWLRLWLGEQMRGEEVRLPLQADAAAVLRGAFRPWAAAKPPVQTLVAESL